MKNIFRSKTFVFTLLGIASLLVSTASSYAQSFHVDIVTSALNLPANSASAPFSLDFQFNSGDTLNNNTAFISNFTFGSGGSPFGVATFIGGASGSLSGMVTLNDTSAFNEFFQSFVAGSSLGFDVSLTHNTEAGPTPDGFSIAILDANLSNIPTTGLGDSLLLAEINGGTFTGSGTGSFGTVTVSITPIPEPSTYGISFAVITFVGVVAHRRRRRLSTEIAAA